jgi:hypothetical protein
MIEIAASSTTPQRNKGVELGLAAIRSLVAIGAASIASAGNPDHHVDAGFWHNSEIIVVDQPACAATTANTIPPASPAAYHQDLNARYTRWHLPGRRTYVSEGYHCGGGIICLKRDQHNARCAVPAIGTGLAGVPPATATATGAILGVSTIIACTGSAIAPAR